MDGGVQRWQWMFNNNNNDDDIPLIRIPWQFYDFPAQTRRNRRAVKSLNHTRTVEQIACPKFSLSIQSTTATRFATMCVTTGSSSCIPTSVHTLLLGYFDLFLIWRMVSSTITRETIKYIDLRSIWRCVRFPRAVHSLRRPVWS